MRMSVALVVLAYASETTKVPKKQVKIGSPPSSPHVRQYHATYCSGRSQMAFMSQEQRLHFSFRPKVDRVRQRVHGNRVA